MGSEDARSWGMGEETERERESKKRRSGGRRESRRGRQGPRISRGRQEKKAQRKNTYNDREKETGGDAMELLRNLWVPRGATPPPGVTTDQQDVGTAFKSHRDSGAPEGVVI